MFHVLCHKGDEGIKSPLLVNYVLNSSELLKLNHGAKLQINFFSLCNIVLRRDRVAILDAYLYTLGRRVEWKVVG